MQHDGRVGAREAELVAAVEQLGRFDVDGFVEPEDVQAAFAVVGIVPPGAPRRAAVVRGPEVEGGWGEEEEVVVDLEADLGGTAMKGRVWQRKGRACFRSL